VSVLRDGQSLKNLVPIADVAAGTCCPKWSRDGRRIAFSDFAATLQGAGLYTVPRTRARKPQLVRKFRASSLVVGWAKSGFVVGVRSALVFAPRTGATRPIATIDDFSQADLASDRYHVAYQSVSSIDSVGIDGKHRTRLLGDPGPDMDRDEPVWSPDRRSVAFLTVDCSDHTADVCKTGGLWIGILATRETRQVSPEAGESDYPAFDWTAR
jgi:Tol biopolymer transport system component